MAWIESHGTLPDHPKLRQLASTLNIELGKAFWHLHCLWLWALKYVGSTGNIGAYGPQAVADGARWEGDPVTLFDALEVTHWVRDGFLNGWQQYTWRYFELVERREKVRSQTRERVRSYRRRVTQVKRNAVTPCPNAPSDQTRPDQTKPRKKRKSNLLSDSEFLDALRANPAYTGIDIDRELGRMDAWLLTPKGRGRSRTRRFVVAWLNRIDQPMSPGGTQAEWDALKREMREEEKT